VDFLNNQASDEGGAYYQDGSTTVVTFRSCSLNNNQATAGSGGAAYMDGTSTTFIGTTFDGNTASDEGGTLYAKNSGATITMQQVCGEYLSKGWDVCCNKCECGVQHMSRCRALVVTSTSCHVLL